MIKFDVFYFEDSDISPVSYLLKQIYPVGSVLFACGVFNLMTVLESVYNSSDFFVVYVDFVPNNESSIDIYSTELLNNELAINSNVLFVPVLCIEYYVLCMLKDDGVLRVRQDWKLLYDALVVNEDYNKATEILNLSLEVLYKRLVANQEQKCTHNVSKLGEYYKSDCKCKFHCDLLISKKLIDKSFSLWRLLPVMDDNIIEDVLPVDCDFRNLSVSDIKAERYGFYTKIFSKFGRSCPRLYND